ncbi:MAG TPA: hypothetical protein VM925_13865, partial [Labilithrix sp.]|nr:hypothetical protein [Labilithrix sp.]
YCRCAASRRTSACPPSLAVDTVEHHRVHVRIVQGSSMLRALATVPAAATRDARMVDHELPSAAP